MSRPFVGLRYKLKLSNLYRLWAFWLVWNPGRSLNCENARSMQRTGWLISSECRHGPRSFSSSTSRQKQMKATLTTSPTGSCLSTVARGRSQASTNKARQSAAVQIATARVQPVWSSRRVIWLVPAAAARLRQTKSSMQICGNARYGSLAIASVGLRFIQGEICIAEHLVTVTVPRGMLAGDTNADRPLPC
jgi:hypothetical protein